ncbi:MAG: TonB-dependent receptor plug domain-containing protein [archaeon]
MSGFFRTNTVKYKGSVNNLAIPKFIIALLIFLSIILTGKNNYAQEEEKNYADMSLEDLLTVDVTVASKKQESISNTPAIVTSFKISEMKSFGIRTLKDALAHVPGILVQDAPVGSVSLMIRGMSETFNQKVLFLVEGVPYWMSSHGDMPILSMPAELIDRVEIIRGPGSVIYGTDATAGVINVIFKKDIDQANISMTGGSFGLLNAGANYSHKTENGYYYAGASVQTMGKGYEALYPKTNLVFPFTVGKRISGNDTIPFPTTGIQTKKEEFYDFSAGAKFNNLNILGHVFKQTTNGLGGAPLIFQTNRLSYQGFLLHADYSQNISKADLNFYADYNPFFLNFDIDNFLATKNAANIVTSSSGKQQYSSPYSNNYRARFGFTAAYPVSETADLLFGVEDEYRKAGQYQKTDASNNLLALQSNVTSVTELSSFLQLDLTFGKIRAVAGARFVKNELAGSRISPRVGLIYNIDDSQSIKLLFSEGFNSPVLSQQDLIIPFVIAGNRNLKAEVIRSVDLAYTTSTTSQILIINGYLISTKNTISRVILPGAAQPQYMNVDGFTRYGVEVDYQRSFGKFVLFSNAAYNAQGNKNYSSDLLAKFVPAVTFNAGLRYKISELQSIGLAERYWSERGTLSAQNITNVAYIISFGALQFSVDAENIFDQNIQNPDVNANAIYSVPGGPGRSFYAGVKYSIF